MIYPSLSAKPRDIAVLTTKPSMHKSPGDISNPNQNISIHIMSSKESPRASGELNPSIWEARGCKLEFKLSYIRDLKINYLTNLGLDLVAWTLQHLVHQSCFYSSTHPCLIPKAIPMCCHTQSRHTQSHQRQSCHTQSSMSSCLWIFLPTLPCVRFQIQIIKLT